MLVINNIIYIENDEIKRKIKKILLMVTVPIVLIFGNVESAEAKGWFSIPGVNGFSPPLGQHRPGRNQQGLCQSAPNQPGPSQPGQFHHEQNHIAHRLAPQNLGGGPGGGPEPLLSNSASDSKLNLNHNDGTVPTLPDYLQSKSQLRKKREKELKEAFKLERELNAKLESKGKEGVVVVFRDEKRFFLREEQLRKKYYHAPDLGCKLPDNLDAKELKRLSREGNYEERKKVFKEIPRTYIQDYGDHIRAKMMHPDTKLFRGTLGRNRAAKDPTSPIIEGYYFYDPKSRFCSFCDDTFLYKSGWNLTLKQSDKLLLEHNLL